MNLQKKMMVQNLFLDYNLIFIIKMKNKIHDDLINDFDNQKAKHLEKLASKMLKQDEKMQKLREKKINKKFLKNF